MTNQFKSMKNTNSNKLSLDKYYTPIKLAKKLIQLTYRTVGKENITEVVEPSAGSGSFSLNIEGCIAYDIEPEHASIQSVDYLKLELPYKKGRLFIGNPPFGSRGVLFRKFFKKAVHEGDYIAFILPSSQYKNTASLYEFNLISSTDLGEIEFSNKKVKCCFNIYQRPKNGLNKRKRNSLQMVKISRQDSKSFKEFDYDIKMCYWGNGSAGKILSESEEYSAMYKIKFDETIRDKAIKILNEVDWQKELNSVSMLKIQQFHIIELLKKKIPNIK